MSAGEVSEALMWLAVIAVIGGGWAVGVNPIFAAVVLAVIVVGLYWWGR